MSSGRKTSPGRSKESSCWEQVRVCANGRDVSLAATSDDESRRGGGGIAVNRGCERKRGLALLRRRTPRRMVGGLPKLHARAGTGREGAVGEGRLFDRPSPVRGRR